MTTWPTGTERPVRNRTPKSLSAWVARSRSVSPAEQAGALPLHDTTPTASIDWTFTPTKPPNRTHASVRADNHAADSVEPAEGPTVIDTSTYAIGPPHRFTRLVPWSLITASGGVWVVWLAKQVAVPDSAIGTVAVIAGAVCGLLLILAQVVDQIGARR